MAYCPNCMTEIVSDPTTCPDCSYNLTQEIYLGTHLPAGTVLLDNYIIGKVLGSGGFGITYLGYDKAAKQKVAIKEYLPSDFATRAEGRTEVSVFSGEATRQFDQGLKSFDSEARRLVAFASSENIVHVYGAFEANNTAYLGATP